MSKMNGTKTFIDHFLVSENLSSIISEFSLIDCVKNKLDQFDLKCGLNIDMSYNNIKVNGIHTNHPAWNSANAFDITLYMELLDSYLLEIPLPLQLINCKNNMCKSHQKAIFTLHGNIVSALVMACEKILFLLLVQNQNPKL